MADGTKREASSMDKKFRFSNTHTDFQARDAKVVFGWRYSPRIIFKAAKGTKLIDMDNNEYYDLTSGMMCMVLGHSHPELTEVMREMAGTFLHQSSWYSNPWAILHVVGVGVPVIGLIRYFMVFCRLQRPTRASVLSDCRSSCPYSRGLPHGWRTNLSSPAKAASELNI